MDVTGFEVLAVAAMTAAACVLVAVAAKCSREARRVEAERTERERWIIEVVDAAITFRPAGDLLAKSVTPERIQDAAAAYGLALTRDEAACVLDARLRLRGWRTRPAAPETPADSSGGIAAACRRAPIRRASASTPVADGGDGL